MWSRAKQVFMSGLGATAEVGATGHWLAASFEPHLMTWVCFPIVRSHLFGCGEVETGGGDPGICERWAVGWFPTILGPTHSSR